MRVSRLALPRLARWATLACFAALPIAACSANKEPAKGQLMLAFQSDMKLPDDVDQIRVVVVQDGVTRFGNTWDVGPNPRETLPATLAVIQGSSSSPVIVRVAALSKGNARVLRQATVTVPTDRIALLPLPLHWLCWDTTLTPVGDPIAPDSYEGVCPEGQTCIAGACTDQTVTATELDTYDPSLVYGGAPPGGNGSCIDVQSCFAAGAQASIESTTVNGKTTKCFMQLPPGASEENLNVGLVLPDANPKGVCDKNKKNCIVALDNDAKLGFRIEGNQVILPNAVCDGLGSADPLKVVSAVAVTTSCRSKTPSYPLCGPWSSVTSMAPNDGGALDGTVTTPDGSVDDSGGGDASPPDGGADASLDSGTDDGGGGDAGAPDASPDAAILPKSNDVGTTCTVDSDCSGGLICVKQAGTLTAPGVGPASGLCSWPCNPSVDVCNQIEVGAVCHEIAPGEAYCVEGCDPKLPAYDPDAGVTTPQCSGRTDMACKASTSGNGAGCAPRCGSDLSCPVTASPDGGSTVSYCHLLDGLCHDKPESTPNIGATCTGAATCTGSTCLGYQDPEGGTVQACSAECTLQGANPGNVCNNSVAGPPTSVCAWPVDPNASAPGAAGQCMQFCNCNTLCTNPGFVCVEITSASWLDPGYVSFVSQTAGYSGFCAPPTGPKGELVTVLGC